MFSDVFPKILSLRDNVEKYCRASEVTENMAHMHYMLDT